MTLRGAIDLGLTPRSFDDIVEKVFCACDMVEPQPFVAKKYLLATSCAFKSQGFDSWFGNCILLHGVFMRAGLVFDFMC